MPPQQPPRLLKEAALTDEDFVRQIELMTERSLREMRPSPGAREGGAPLPDMRLCEARAGIPTPAGKGRTRALSLNCSLFNGGRVKEEHVSPNASAMARTSQCRPHRTVATRRSTGPRLHHDAIAGRRRRSWRVAASSTISEVAVKAVPLALGPWLKEICPRGNNKVFFISLYHDKCLLFMLELY